jgi:hypothetical protein
VGGKVGSAAPRRAGAGSRRAVRLCTQGRLKEEGGNKWRQTRTSTRVLRVLLIGSLIPQHSKGWDLLLVFVMQLGWAPMLSASRHHYITSTALTEALGAIGSVAAAEPHALLSWLVSLRARERQLSPARGRDTLRGRESKADRTDAIHCAVVNRRRMQTLTDTSQ